MRRIRRTVNVSGGGRAVRRADAERTNRLREDGSRLQMAFPVRIAERCDCSGMFEAQRLVSGQEE